MASHVGINLKDTFGAGFIGAMVTAVLYGLTTLQTYLYYLYYPEDGRHTKFLVFVIWFLDTTHLAFMCHAIYYYLVLNYTNPSALATGVWSLYASIGLNLAIAVLVQTFFCCRIFDLCQSKVRWWLTSFVLLVVFGHFCFGVETVVLLFIKKDFARVTEITEIAIMPFAIFAVLSDILIAASLCVIMYGNKTAFSDTNSIINTLIIYAINRCLLTAAVAIAEVSVFVVMPHNLWYLAIDFIIGKLYANSFLAHLNARHSLRLKILEGSVESDVTSSPIILSDFTSSTEWKQTRSVESRFYQSDKRPRTTESKHTKSLESRIYQPDRRPATTESKQTKFMESRFYQSDKRPRTTESKHTKSLESRIYLPDRRPATTESKQTKSLESRFYQSDKRPRTTESKQTKSLESRIYPPEKRPGTADSLNLKLPRSWREKKRAPDEDFISL